MLASTFCRTFSLPHKLRALKPIRKQVKFLLEVNWKWFVVIEKTISWIDFEREKVKRITNNPLDNSNA